MNKNDVKYMLLCILMMIFILFLSYFSFRFIFSRGYILLVNNKNKQEISEMLEKEGVQENNFTRLELKQGFRNGELKIYNHLKLCDTKKVSESSDVMVYMWENGYSLAYKYVFLVLGTIILITVNKELINRLNDNNRV